MCSPQVFKSSSQGGRGSLGPARPSGQRAPTSSSWWPLLESFHQGPLLQRPRCRLPVGLGSPRYRQSCHQVRGGGASLLSGPGGGVGVLGGVVHLPARGWLVHAATPEVVV